MKFEIEPELPPIQRRTKSEEEFRELLDVLSDGKVVGIPDVQTSKQAQQTAMRVRYFANKRGFGLTQRYSPDERKLYLQKN